MAKRNWIGHALGGRYKIESLIGQGGMSSVYKASDPNLKRVVAVKMIHPHLSSDPEFIQRFETEAAAVAQLRHMNIVQVFDFDHEGDIYFMVLEFIPGETLQDRLKRLNSQGRRLSDQEIIYYSSGIADAVHYAHKRGMIHRDIKPANILLDIQGDAILTDFGIAKIVGDQHFTATGAVLGTALYMSPEQIQGKHPDHRTDIYSLGVMLFEMVCGRPPYEADSAISVMQMHVNNPIPDLSEINPDTLPALRAIIEKSLEKDPDNRFSSAAEMRQALQQVDLGVETSAPVSAATVIEDTPVEESPSAVSFAAAAATLVDPDEPSLSVEKTIQEQPPPAAEPIPPDAATLADAEKPVAQPIGETIQEPPSTAEPSPPDASTLSGAPAAVEEVAASPQEATLVEAPESAATPGEATIVEDAEPPAPPSAQPPEHHAVPVSGTPTLLQRIPNWAWPVVGILILGLLLLAVRPWNLLSSTGSSQQVETIETEAPVVVESLPTLTSPPLPTAEPTLEPIATTAPLVPVTVNNAHELTQRQLLGRGALISAALNPTGDQLALAGSLGIWIYDLANPENPRYLDGHSDRVGSVAWSPEGNALASASDDTTILVWDPVSGDILQKLIGHSRRVRTVAWSPGGDLLASGGSDGEIRIWDPATGQEVDLLSGNALHVWDVAWSPPGGEIAWGSDDGRVRIQAWDRSHRGEVRSLRGHSGNVWQVFWAQDGSQLASIGEDETVRVWDSVSGSLLQTFNVSDDWFSQLGWHPSETLLTSEFHNGETHIKKVSTGELMFSTGGFLEWVTQLAWDPAGEWIAGGSLDSTVRFWELASGAEKETLPHSGGPVTGLALTNAGDRLAAGSPDGSWEIWMNSNGWELSHTGAPLSGGISVMDWSADDRMLALAGAGGSITLWDSENGALHSLEGHRDDVTSLAWSPAGQQLASGSLDNAARIWDTGNGQSISVLTGHGDAVVALAWSPDGSSLATASADGVVRIWDPLAGTVETSFEEGDQILALAWSPDGSLMVTGSTDGNDGLVRIWDPRSGEALAELTGHRSAVTSLGWGPDGARLASGSREGAIRIWALPEGSSE